MPNISSISSKNKSTTSVENTAGNKGRKASKEAKRQQMIATAAYLRAERRGFCDGNAVQDWLEAEAEIDATANSAK